MIKRMDDLEARNQIVERMEGGGISFLYTFQKNFHLCNNDTSSRKS